MPDTFAQWCWFVFYTGGALAGWGFAGLVAPVVVDEARRRWSKGR